MVALVSSLKYGVEECHTHNTGNHVSHPQAWEQLMVASSELTTESSFH